MIIPATLIINMGDFTIPQTLTPFFAIIELVIQFSNAFMQLFLSPLSFLSINFWHSDMMIIFFYNVSIIVP